MPGVRAGPGVEQQGGPALPGLLLAADHQLAVVRAVDASAPAAGRRRRGTREVASSSPARRPSGAGSRRCRSIRRRSRTVGSGSTCGVHDQTVAVAVNARLSSHSPNGSVSRTASGPIAIAAAHVGADRVAHRSLRPVPAPVEDEPGPGAERVRQPVLDQQHAGREAGQVLQARRTRAGVRPATRRVATVRRQAGPGTGYGRRRRRHQRQRDQQDRRPGAGHAGPAPPRTTARPAPAARKSDRGWSVRTGPSARSTAPRRQCGVRWRLGAPELGLTIAPRRSPSRRAGRSGPRRWAAAGARAPARRAA